MKLQTFKNQVTKIFEAITKQSDRIEEVTRVALTQYAEHGDTSFLVFVVFAAMDCASINDSKLRGYIKAHANVSIDVEKRTITKKSKRSAIAVTMPTDEECWYEFGKAPVNQTDMDLLKRLASLLNTYEKAKDETRAKQSAQADRLVALITSELQHAASA